MSAISITLSAAALLGFALLLRRLPLQNVLAAGIILFVVAYGIESSAAAIAIPFHSRIAASVSSDAKIVLSLRALFWIGLVILPRELIRWLLRRRCSGNYGLALFTSSTVIAASLHFGINAFEFHDFSWKNFPGEILTGAALLLSAAPWLIDKKPPVGASG